MRSSLRISTTILLATLTIGPCLEMLPAAAAGSSWADGPADVFVARIASKHKHEAKDLGKLIACIGKRPATARQRRIALRRARLAYRRMSAARRSAARLRSRYLAIQTERDALAKGAITCMVFDTRTMQIVGEKVYDCETEPPIGTGLKFESFVATYVGS